METIKRFDEWKLKYPSKTIGHHHYIRERDILKFILSEKEAWKREAVEKIEKWNESKFMSDCLGEKHWQDLLTLVEKI
jgi:hypothetical protein